VTQLELTAPRPRNPIARKHDPDTSKQAAEAITASGKRDAQAKAVHLAVRGYRGHTSAELAKLCGYDRHMVARRLPELERLGLVQKGEARACSTTGKSATTWWPR
jgi:CRP-like cAMP-binding protein